MIHILCVDLSGADRDCISRLYQAATPERRHRADSLRKRPDQLRCLAADALLRTALGTSHYTEERGPWGKPRIPGRPDFHYNLSHSGSCCVLAWGEAEVGVDVQEIRADAPVEALAHRYFTEEERQYLLPDPVTRFFELWTGKESYLKFLGTGLSRDLRSFSVLSPEPGIRYRHWELPDGYHLCLCAEDPDADITFLPLCELR